MPDQHSPSVSDSGSTGQIAGRDLDGQAEGVRWGGGLYEAADLVTPMAIRVAATLRVADHIVSGRRTVEALAEVTGVNGDALTRVLAHLVVAGVLTRAADGCYSLARLGEYLRDDNPDGIREWLDLDGGLGNAAVSIVQLLHTVRTGQPGFPRQFGRSFWEDLSDDPARAASFDALMGARLVAEAPAVAGAYDWGALGHVVDVGGGNATLLTAILRAHHELRGSVVDLPGPVARAAATIQAAGLGGRANVVAGSFFDPLPAGAGGYILSEVLHNWDDPDAQRILQQCAVAAAPHGAVLVVEVIGDDGLGPRTEIDLRVLTCFGGRERSLEQFADLAAATGLRITSVVSARWRSIIEMRQQH